MRKLKLAVQVSIDGYMATGDGKTDWMIWNWGPEWTWDNALQNYHTELTKSADCFLLSRGMVEEGFIAHWQKVAEDVKGAQSEFARHITDTHKLVFTSTLDESVSVPGGWTNASVVRSPFIGAITELKKQVGKDIIVYGGVSFVSSLISAGLIDEFHLFVNPVALGDGLRAFCDLPNYLNLKLSSSIAYACGVTVLVYKSENG